MIRVRSLARFAGCLWMAAGVPSAVAAASFTVSPTQVFLTPKATSALLTLRNESDDTIRFQLTVFKWDQSPGGDLEMLPTEDIVLFPKLVALAPHEQRKVRIGTLAAFESIEKTYRVFVEELPATAKPESSASGVRMRTRMGIPIFMAPAKARAGATVTRLNLENGRVMVRIGNSGTAHFVTDTVRVTGASAQGAIVFDKVVNGWYILAGRTQFYEIPLTPAECEPAVVLAVEVKIGDTILREQAERPAHGCGAAVND